MLGACKRCGADAVEQVRGGMIPVDHGFVGGDAYNSTASFDPLTQTVVPPARIREHQPASWSSNSPANASDTRVTCTKCDNATGWNKQDVADYTRFVWNRDHAGSTQPGNRDSAAPEDRVALSEHESTDAEANA